ncbi:uncharacterized protein MELLADRAFT_103039 [Melampsora larici-populina 98AG31]|uniref:Secreted protein n=1 Tax=Melampsora larici-populina (strain 98AG31 / pathotype 3-4-7) TaxID=747676 RepID=F4RAC6_MELLP|nr:uncharacterized protein MELLADRAFT_103039 [Melampsora larici-populina 98AG31]EGG10457.1 secreted protein [Melampsora larici-populina 98AG31]
MLHVFLKLSILLFSFLIHDVSGATSTNDPPPVIHSCNTKFRILGDRAECTGADVVRNCAYKSCWLAGHQYIPMTECKLEKSTDKRLSHQECAQYEFIDSDLRDVHFKCKNPGLVDYLCADNANNIGKVLGCSDCYP